jgi:hypothetical protein
MLVIRLIDRNRREIRRLEASDFKQAVLKAQELANENRGLYAMVTFLRAGAEGVLAEGYVTRRLTEEQGARVQDEAAAEDEFIGFLAAYPEFWA